MKIVVAYSGGLDTSVILHWLKETYRCEIVAFCADIGQEEELAGLDVISRALITGQHPVDLLRAERSRPVSRARGGRHRGYTSPAVIGIGGGLGHVSPSAVRR